MEISDEYQDLGNPGGGVAIANGMSLEHHRHSPDSPLSHQEEDLSDPDLQDEESGEELPQQPHQANTHTSDSPSVPTSTPTPLAHLSSLMNHHPHFLSKFKMESDADMFNNKSSIEALQAAMGTGTFNLPFSFPPPAAFLTPQHHNNHHHSSIGTVNTANNAVASSADSHSSESSQGSARNASDARETSGSQSQNNTNNNNNNSHQQQTSWSFEEQFKQVRQLYEINDDPKRKEFLDDLFSYMQKRGTPINRLPIMAKSVLDLYELYNLVIARGGLVDVINKKLWQEIIKGLHLPSSITSAAFTLRTQYMKYLYPYECEKLRLSSPAELQAAIDGNRREGRRSSYGAYAGGTGAGDNMISRNPHPPSSLASLHAQVSPMSLVTGGQHHGSQSLVNGSAAHTPLTHHPHLPQHAQGPLAHQPNAGSIGLPMEIEARMVEYMKLMKTEMRIGGSRSPPPIANRQASPPATPPRDMPPFNALGLSFWNLYNNNTLYSNLGHQQQLPMSPQTSQSPNPQSSSPEPQREALDLGLRSPPMSTSPSRQSPTTSAGTIQTRREKDVDEDGPPAPKRPLNDDEMSEKQAPLVLGANIKITNRNDGGNSEHSLSVSIELNGTTYQGVLFPQGDSHNAPSTTTTNNHQKTVA